ncbi:MAG: DNA polymerase III subunit beta [Myxococcota bacterium]|jgi:DNA polymerase III subunit beta|nr:DNA polymerase III subunit beta [Myxococcota bacterium]
MKLAIDKSELLKALSRLQAIVEKRNSMPILANVLLDASKKGDKGTLQFSATDLEVGIRAIQPVEVSEAGSLTVSAKKFFEIVRELPDEKVKLEATPNAYLDIRCGRAHFTLAGTAAEEYPSLPEFSPENPVTLPAEILSGMIERTMYASSVDETRYNLNGVYFEVQDEQAKLRMVATDGHRLAMVDRAIPATADGLKGGVIIPRKGLAELKRLLDEDDATEVELAFEGNNGMARKGDVTLVMRLIEGEFPNYQQVIPSEPGVQLVLDTERLSKALRRVVLLSSERSRAVKLEISNGEAVVTSNNPDLGDARDEIDVDYAGETLSIGFNARYVLDALNSLHSKEIRLGIQGDLSPALLVPTNDEDALAVVMPMRI